MYKSVLKYKWAALAAVAVVFGGLQYFLGQEGGGLLGQAPEELTVQDAPEENPEPQLADAGPDMDGFYEGRETEFGSDSELIETTDGLDPTPQEEPYDDPDDGITATGDPEVLPEADEDYEEPFYDPVEE